MEGTARLFLILASVVGLWLPDTAMAGKLRYCWMDGYDPLVCHDNVPAARGRQARCDADDACNADREQARKDYLQAISQQNIGTAILMREAESPRGAVPYYPACDRYRRARRYVALENCTRAEFKARDRMGWP